MKYEFDEDGVILIGWELLGGNKLEIINIMGI